MKDNWSEMLIPGKLASRLIRGKNSVNSTIGRKRLSELTEDLTYVNPTYPRFVVLKTINIIGTAAFCPSWAKIRLTRVRLIRGLLYIAFPIEIIVTTLAFTYICLFFFCFFLLFCKLCFSHTSWIGKISNKTIVVDIHLFFCL